MTAEAFTSTKLGINVCVFFGARIVRDKQFLNGLHTVD